MPSAADTNGSETDTQTHATACRPSHIRDRCTDTHTHTPHLLNPFDACSGSLISQAGDRLLILETRSLFPNELFCLEYIPVAIRDQLLVDIVPIRKNVSQFSSMGANVSV